MLKYEMLENCKNVEKVFTNFHDADKYIVEKTEKDIQVLVKKITIMK